MIYLRIAHILQLNIQYALCYKATSSEMIKWPYKRDGLIWVGQFNTILLSQYIWNLTFYAVWDYCKCKYFITLSIDFPQYVLLQIAGHDIYQGIANAMAGDSEDAYIGLGKSVVKESMNLKNKMATHSLKLFNKI